MVEEREGTTGAPRPSTHHCMAPLTKLSATESRVRVKISLAGLLTTARYTNYPFKMSLVGFKWKRGLC